ncbi:hypothetical protein ABT120_16725 [Nonomuraea angiospora]
MVVSLGSLSMALASSCRVTAQNGPNPGATSRATGDRSLALVYAVNGSASTAGSVRSTSGTSVISTP